MINLKKFNDSFRFDGSNPESYFKQTNRSRLATRIEKGFDFEKSAEKYHLFDDYYYYDFQIYLYQRDRFENYLVIQLNITINELLKELEQKIDGLEQVYHKLYDMQ